MSSTRASGLLKTDADLSRQSYYDASAGIAEVHPTLVGEHHCDVAIVGGGLAGLSAALELTRRGYAVRLLEARQIGSGASGRNGGQAIHGLACDQDEIEAQLGAADARRIWNMSIEALDLIRDRCREHHIDCEWRDGYLGVAVTAAKGRDLHTWARAMTQRYDYPLTCIDQADMPGWITSPRYVAGVHDPRSGHLHPLKYARGLARAAARSGALLHEHTPVTRLESGVQIRLHTPQGSVQAKQVLLAGNIYLPALLESVDPGLSSALKALDQRIMPVGTYIVCSEPMDAQRCKALIPSGSAVCDNNFVLDYFRPTHDHRMLYGGRVSYSTVTPHDMASGLRRRMVQTFPQLRDLPISHAWGGFVDITMNRAPDFNRLGAHRNIYYLQGFSGHGLALTGLAGLVAAQAMSGDSERFDVFARLRHRPFPGGRLLRMPSLVLGMLYYRLKDLL